jgi:oxalate decarboxylase
MTEMEPAPSETLQPDIEAASRHTPVEAEGSMSDGSEARRSSVAPAPGGWSSQHPHLFHLGTWSPSVFDGGTLQGATAENWPLLVGQQGSVYLARLEVGGVREPHWHPSAWELNFVISGQARWSLVGPKATHDSFEAGPGDLVFAPQGHFHYFENASDSEDLVVLIVFNASAGEPDDDIGIVASLSAMPPDALAAVFGASPEAFQNLPHKIERVTIARKTKG